MKLRLLIPAIALVLGSMNANAVTDKEMDHARAIAAQAYLRYANNGSGYLDDITVSSMAELEGKLKPKEKENLKAFKAVKTPGDYASWDKDKLVQYWGTTFFQSAGLDAEGKKGAARARKRVSQLTVSAPQAAPAAQPAAAQPAASEPAQPAATEQPTAADSSQEVAEEIAKSEEIAAQMEEEPIKKKNSGTWVYVVILCVLVAVVVWLVVFASNVLKKQTPQSGGKGSAPYAPSGADMADDSDVAAMRHKFAETIAKANEEKAALKSQLDALRNENGNLTAQLNALKTRYVSAQAELNAVSAKLEKVEVERDEANARANAAVAAAAAAPKPAPAPQPAVEAPAPRPAASQRPARTIYLGRANANHIFVRADKDISLGNSIFRLVTSDGLSGSFYVIDDAVTDNIIFVTPEELLGNACICSDFNATDGKTTIVTVTPGTAVFEGGRWKVTRKAQILYR